MEWGKNRVSTEDFAFPPAKTIFKIFERVNKNGKL
jgi:hypothetical protein